MPKSHQPHPHLLALHYSDRLRGLGFLLRHLLGPGSSMQGLVHDTFLCLCLFDLRLGYGTAPASASQFEGFAMERTYPDQSFFLACSPVNQPNMWLKIFRDCFATDSADYSIESTDSS